METREAKRARFSNLAPQVVAGVVCASHSAAHAGAYPFSFFPSPADLDEFIPQNANDKTFDISQDCMDGLHNPDLPESQQRDKIYAEFKRHGIVVPDGCKSASTSRQNNFMELDMNVFFQDIAKGLGLETKKLKRIEQALVVTSTSKPDLSSVSPRDLKLGEFKHAPIYTRETSYRQGFLYMYAWMYYLRVKQGLPVTTVYGFGFCGHKCSDNKSAEADQDGEYSVGLFKLTAPEELDTQYECLHYWETFSTSDDKGMKMLFRFLKYGYESDLASSTVTKLQKSSGDRRPCLFCLPQDYWEDSTDCTLVKNGAKAIVFRVTLEKVQVIWKVLKITKYQWKLFGKWYTNEPEGRTYYVKIRTTDMHPVALANVLGENLSDLIEEDPTFSQLYPLPPIRKAGCIAVLMNDMGSRVMGKPEEFENFSELQTLFRDLKIRTLAVSDTLQNTDALAHNLVLEKSSGGTKKLHLIDWDEGAVTGDIPAREQDPNNAGKSEWIAFLMYPNCLRLKQGDWYTKVQLVVALIVLALERRDLSDQQMDKLDDIISAAEFVSNNLKNLPQTKGVLDETNAQNLLALDSLCDELLS